MTRPEIESLFQERGLRLTPQRFALMDYVVHSHEHPTADQIYEAVNRHDPSGTKATVYNNLRALVDAGLVREVPLEGRAARFDVNLVRHHHFICDHCGALEDVDWFDVERPSRLGGRSVRACEVILRGLCAECKTSAKQASPKHS